MNWTKRLSGILSLFILLAGFHEAKAQQPCNANFFFNNNPAGSTVTFNSAPNPPGTIHLWDFGDSTSGFGSTTTHTYSAPGVYTACLVVVNQTANCVDSNCVSIVINGGGPGNCTAGFSVNATGLRAHFSSMPNPPGSSFSWDFGDSTTGVGSSPNHVYSSPGTYIACLIVSNQNTNCADTFCTSVTVNSPPPCQVGYQFGPTPVGGAFFNAYTQGGIPPYTYTWDFGDGSTGTGATVNHQYNAPGSYIVCVTSVSSDSCVSTFCDTIMPGQLGPGPGGCLARFNPVVQGLTVNFNNNSQGAGPLSYFWDFGDSTTSTAYSPTHTYSSPGLKLVTLIVSDTSGCGDTALVGFGVGLGGGPSPGPCSVAFQSFDSAGSAHFFAMPNGNIIGGPATFYWSFGDGTNDTTTHPFANHNYGTNGMYYACLTMVTFDSCVATFCDSVLIGPPANPTCQAGFWASPSPNMGGQGNHTHFNNMSSSNDHIAAWHWDFGDGDTSIAHSPIHNYSAPGSYVVCLTMTTVNGCVDTHCDTVTIHPPSVNLWVNHHHFTSVTPGFPLWTHIHYSNLGSLASNAATVTYRYPQGVYFRNAHPMPSNVDTANRLITWNVGVVNPHAFGSGFMRVDFRVDSFLTLGNATFDTVWITPNAGDIDTANNISTIIDTVVGSWDPNDKSAFPAGEGENGNVDPNTSEINYLIRFQNTGTGPAVNVAIRDTLSAHLDPSSIQMMDASHSYTMDIEQGNILIWRFANIYLPDSNSNEPESHGYVNFRIKLDQGLPLGTRIENKAAIYFDFNAPVITNTAVSTLYEKTVGVNTLIPELDLVIMPNPSQGDILINAEDNVQNVRVYDLMGQEVFRQSNLDQQLVKLNLGNLASGTYLVRVQSDDKFTTKKLVIQN